ncbi:MAG: hypothetical protein QOF85_435 [Solirubrobacterales bacterium]|jgi:hypothetical protein|nr:hypothetical protein [Solirubrobacterales bacterium]
MSRTSKVGAALALVVSVVAFTAIPAGAAKPGQTVTVPSALKISAYGYKGKVTSGNPNCIAERTVVLKQKGHGLLGRTKSTDTGSWEVSPEELKFKGPLPYKLYAEVKPLTQATAGPIYKCEAATSKTIEIAGG